MKKLFVYGKGYRKECVLAPLFKLFEAVLELLVPLAVARLIDVSLPEKDAALTGKLFLLLVLLALAGLAFSVTAQWFAAKAATGFAAGIRRALFEKIGTFSVTHAESLGTPTLLTRLTGDVNQVQTGINLTLRLLLRSPFIVFGAMVMAFTVDSKEAVVFAVLIPSLAAAVTVILLLGIPLYQKVQAHLDALMTQTRDMLTGVRVLRAFNREKEEEAAFGTLNASLEKSRLRAGKVTALLNPLSYVLLNIAVAVLLSTGAVRVSHGTLSAGALVALYNYTAQISVELIKLADLILTVTRALASANRVAALLDEPSDDVLTEGEEITGGDVTFEDVSYRYPNASADALRHVSFSVKSGARVGIIGSTGAGKSTLVNLLPRLLTPTGGRVFVGGRDITEQPTAPLRRAVCLVPQQLDFFAGTVADNLFGRGDKAASLAAAQATVFTEEKGGLSAAVAPRGKNFSGGERQRLAIARALNGCPRILISDDASSALDFLTEKKIREALETLSCTVFTVSQRTAAIEKCDLILVLEEGELVGKGTHEELLASCPVYREIYESQQ